MNTKTSSIKVDDVPETLPKFDPKDKEKVAEAKKQIHQTRFGRMHDVQLHKDSSHISIMNINENMAKTSKMMNLHTHTLHDENPLSWNNIPSCVAQAVHNIITHIVSGDDTLLNYQIDTNNRIYKL